MAIDLEELQLELEKELWNYTLVKLAVFFKW
jgi:hypothetical protein